MAVDFKLKGLPQSVDLPADTPLIYVLRNELQLHGAKLGCAMEQCGACVVLVDGAPTYACTAPLSAVADRQVDTVEGLADNGGQPHPLQEAFEELNAMQCGYCSAGILMRLKALLDTDQHPDRRTVQTVLEGHLCRCGAHPRVLAAMERAIALRAVKRP